MNAFGEPPGALVAISSRSLERSEALARELNCRALPWSGRYDIKPGIIVNGTPVGMHPNVDETPYAKDKLANLMRTSDSVIVFDTVYNPEQTLLVKDATSLGAMVVSGVDMFIRQAAYQYKLFTGLTPPTDLMRKTLRLATSPIRYREEEEDKDDKDDKDSKGDIDRK